MQYFISKNIDKEGVRLTQYFKVEEASITDITQGFEKNILSSKELVLMYLERIAQYDQKGPKLNSVLEINPDAIHIAEAMDYERKTKGLRSQLHGIPVLLKDNIDTEDKMHTSAGSLALKDSYANEDAFLVKQLRKAGAIILGKTNMTEWANFMTEGMPAGYSSRGGQVLNPYDPKNLTPGGSSSGSGVAVSSNFVTVAVGTETSGSVISPSTENSIVGLKPTIGLISRSGIIPISNSQDTAGPMGKTVEDVAILLNGMTGIDVKDPITQTSKDYVGIDYTTFLNRKGLDNVRIGVPRNYFFDSITTEEVKVIEKQLDAIEQAGATIIDPIEISSAKDIHSKIVMLYEFKPTLNAYLSKLKENVPIHSLEELINYNNRYAEIMLKYGQTDLIASEKTSGTLTELEYIQSRTKDLQLSTTEGIDKVMNKHKLDALIFPSYTGVEIIAKAGYPSITVPAGYLENKQPFGITFAGQAYSEGKLLQIAYAYEQLTQIRKAPQL